MTTNQTIDHLTARLLGHIGLIAECPERAAVGYHLIVV
jgi:hypothetical protein